MSPRDHQDYRDDVGAFLLGALPGPERQAFESHLSGCAECRDEVERLRHAAEALPRSVEQLEPPPTLRAALLAEVREADDHGPGLIRRLLSAPRGLRPAVAWAGAAAVLAIGVIAGFGLAKALSGDEVRTLSASAGKGTLARAGGTLTLTGEGEKGAILRVNGLPRPPSTEVYQAWVQRKGAMAPEPTFEVGRDGRGAVAVPDDLSGADAVLVTREPRGGSPAPTAAPLLRVGL
jgi:anti-sigma-K factor RskA